MWVFWRIFQFRWVSSPSHAFHYHGYEWQHPSSHNPWEVIYCYYRGGDWCAGRYHVLLVVCRSGRVLFPSTHNPFYSYSLSSMCKIELVNEVGYPKGSFLSCLSRIHQASLVLETLLLVLGTWWLHHHSLLQLLPLPPFRHHLLLKVRVKLKT